MAKKTSIKNKLKFFISELKKNINVKSAYCFGSYADGTQKLYSDIDIAVVSKDFKGFKFEDRKLVNPIILRTNINIELHPFTVQEFKKKNPFINEIIKSGIRIV